MGLEPKAYVVYWLIRSFLKDRIFFDDKVEFKVDILCPMELDRIFYLCVPSPKYTT